MKALHVPSVLFLPREMGRGRRMGRGAESTDRSRAEMPLGDPFVFRSAPLVIPWRPFRFLYCRFQLLKIAELLHLRWKTDRRGLLLLFIGGKKGPKYSTC